MFVRKEYADEIWQFLDPEKDCRGADIVYDPESICYWLQRLLGGSYEDERLSIGDYIIRTGETFLVVSEEKYLAMGWEESE